MRAQRWIPLLQLWIGWSCLARAQQTFFPPAVPLAVRSPTFNCWLDLRSGGDPMNTWPKFWNDQHILGWTGYIKVDGSTWHWLGDLPVNESNASKWLNTEVTPTRTILTVQAGPIVLNVTFLSPVEPSDWTRQSFPFSYLIVDGEATDGRQHAIQLYSDISAEWVSNSTGTSIGWSTNRTSNTIYHQVQPSSPIHSFSDVAEDTTAYYAIAAGQPGLVSVIGNALGLRAQFAAGGTGLALTSDLNTSVGTVQDGSGEFPVFAHAVNLGLTQTFSDIAWAVGVVRNPLLTSAGVARRAYFWSQYSTIGDAIDAFVADFPSARERAVALDQKILQDARVVSQDYADLVSLATRQTIAGVEITLSETESGQWNMSDSQAFMKDVGNSQRVNPTETIYAALPALIYLNASLSGLLLEPLLRFQSSPSYGNPYAAPDLGTPYPLAPGNAGDEAVYGVENSGNMLILVLAHARTSGDGSLIGKYYDLLNGWAEYLVTNALIPAQQKSADARDTTLVQTQGNNTNLAIKGIIAIQAMSEISQLAGRTADAQKYAATTKSLTQSWIKLTQSSGSLRWTYGSDSSFGLMYNFFPDRLLQLNVLPPSIYTAESSSLSTPSKAQPFGFPLSSDSDSNTRSDWTLFSAAAAPDAPTRNLLISAVRQRASDNSTMGPFSNSYSSLNGVGIGVGSPNGFATPAQGAMFSVLSLNVQNKTVVVPALAVTNSHKNTPAIAGGIVGALAGVVLIGLAIFFWRRRKTTADAITTPQPYRSEMTDVSQHDLNISPYPLTDPSYKGTSTNPRTEADLPESSASGARGTDELRNEMQTLRREIDQLRATQGVLPDDVPPAYQ
ncbi:DUF1793-domain-containing protein [Mycena latifolia]|nr:DUF1793-domain-containing protein [Mycena latifolia]